MRRSCPCVVSGVVLVWLIVSTMSWADWAENLSYDGGGYWDTRVTVEVKNVSDRAVEGAPVRIAMEEAGPTGELIGAPVASIRVVNAAGIEFIHGLVGTDGAAKDEGAIEAGDVLEVATEVAAEAVATVFLYAGNERAWAPPEMLRAGLANHGFEKGETSPEGWTAIYSDASHRLVHDRAAPRSGEACVRCEVDAGAGPTWVQYRQSGLSVQPGDRVRFSAWAKAENIEGKAGWYIHVHGDQPMLFNQTAGWPGTFDWREAVIEFEVPEGGRTLTCGTLLHGSGTAWFDDVALEIVKKRTGLSATAVAGEKRILEPEGQDAAWPDDPSWAWRAPILVRSFSDQAITHGVVTFDTRRIRNRIVKLIGFDKEPRLQVLDGAKPTRFSGTLDKGLHIITDVPARSEKALWLYVNRESSPPGEAQGATLADWAAAPMNLLANGSVEAGEGERPDGWTSSQENGPSDRFTARRVPGGVEGEYCLELNVPQSDKPGWNGWRQTGQVKPSTRYMLAGYMKTKDVGGWVRIHGHFHRADGSHTERPFFGTGPDSHEGDTDWFLTSATVTTPPDCASISVHLTMNTHGTLWHDAVLLVEATTGIAGELEARVPPRKALEAWTVNPLVKVFQQDLPPAKLSGELQMHAGRNSYEAGQVCVRASSDTPLRIEATPLTGPGGATIDAPTVYQVGYVPIDFPIGYDSTTEPKYHRLLPKHRGNDGWAGEWPDPLVPLGDGSLQLEAGQTRPLWFDVHIPADTEPGAYEGEIIVKADAETLRIPLTLTVWNFVHPEAKHLLAMYDLRKGHGQDPFAGPDRREAVRTWYRFLARYNVSPGFIIPSAEFAYADGVVTMDTEAFDDAAGYLLDELKCKAVYTPHFFYACGWAYMPKEIFGLERFSPEYTKAWTDAYRMFIDHITEKGWRDQIVYYLSDEPHDSNLPTIEALAKVADMATSIAPDVPVYSSTWRYIVGLADHLTMWGIGPHGSFNEEKRLERKAAGDRFLFTTDGQMCTDTPYLAIERLLPWFCLKYGVEGYEFWGVSWWTYDPWERGWHTFIRQSSEGENYYYVRYPNGDGYLAYPNRGLSLPEGGTEEKQGLSPAERASSQTQSADGTVPAFPAPTPEPLPSIRLVAAREGVDDYELFLALEQLAQQGNADAQAALNLVCALVNMPNPGGRHSTAIMPDPDAVVAARIAVGETLNARPR